MKQNNQLSDVLHVLLHMAEGDGPATSGTLATAMKNNPMALRRLMVALRNAGFVASEKGHGGGWVLNCPSVEWLHGTADGARVASDGWLGFRVGSEIVMAQHLHEQPHRRTTGLRAGRPPHGPVHPSG